MPTREVTGFSPSSFPGRYVTSARCCGVRQYRSALDRTQRDNPTTCAPFLSGQIWANGSNGLRKVGQYPDDGRASVLGQFVAMIEDTTQEISDVLVAVLALPRCELGDE